MFTSPLYCCFPIRGCNTILCININLTKEIRNFMRISFFANNMFRSTPIWESKVYPGKYTRRNAKTFFFGAALSVKIR